MNQEIALTKPDSTFTMDTLRAQMEAAKRFVDSGLMPPEVNTPQKALVLMQAGRELGVPPTYAIRNVHIVKGKPVCSAELMLALVRRTYGPGAIRVGKTSNTSCTVQYREQGWDGVSEYTFTLDDAKAAGVANSGTWRAYPAAMLRARCISAVVRFAFPEAIAGLYTPEELGAEVVVTDEGHVNVIDVPSSPVEPLLGEIPGPTPIIDAERARAVEADPVAPSCDKARWNRAWHAAVKGTAYATEQGRHDFLDWFTEGACTSLSEYLETSNDEEAEALIATAIEQIRQADLKQPEPAF
jgi:hypothetical protein